MIRFILAFLILTYAINSSVQDRGIRFFQGSWEELLTASKQSGKPIFIDVHTDWCIPCKKMEKEVFTLPEVAKFYNDHFISYRLNAEKGEGPALARQFQVKAYPTWLFLNPDASLRSRSTDYLPAGPFIAIAKLALASRKVAETLSLAKTRFDQGDRSTDFLRSYLEQLKKLELDNSKVLEAYVRTLEKDKIDTAEINYLIKQSGRNWSSAIPLIVTRLNTLDTSAQKQAASDLFTNVLYFTWGNAVKSKESEHAQRSHRLAEKIQHLLSDQQQRSYDRLELFHYRTFKDKIGLKKLAYHIAIEPMSVDPEYAATQDSLLFNRVKDAFSVTPKDSTEQQAIVAEKKLALHQYSGQISSLLFQLAQAFEEVLDVEDPGRKDAFIWAQRAYLLTPNPGTKQLMDKLR